MVLVVYLGGCGASAAPPAVVASPRPGFWDHWGDGRAEIDAYELVTPRYGELRKGTAVLVFVTEDFTEGARVKSDGGHGDEYPVLKLNDVRHFQTGVYDYEVMTSVFVRADGRAPLGQPVKTSLGVQEWCGHVYAMLLPRAGKLEYTLHSYFDGEADRDEELALPRDGILADALPIAVRGELGELVAPGATVEVPALPTLLTSRFAHVPPAWTRATLRRSAETQTITVPAGSFEVWTVDATVGDVTTTWEVEAAAPHRIVRWERTDGEKAALIGSERLPYWQLHGEGDEQLLEKLGLTSDPGHVAPTTP